MLVLTRRENEVVVLHIPPSTESRTVRIAMVRAPVQCRLGIDAPEEIGIAREELLPEGHQWLNTSTT